MMKQHHSTPQRIAWNFLTLLWFLGLLVWGADHHNLAVEVSAGLTIALLLFALYLWLYFLEQDLAYYRGRNVEPLNDYTRRLP